MYSHEGSPSQLTFYYTNGQSESFNISVNPEEETPQDFRLEIRHFLQKDWWILNLPEQTVMINVANVVKLEIKPVIQQIQGQGVFTNAERVTALNRAR